MQRIVMKFGGTSMGSADAMQKASAIVRAHNGEVIVVVSAVSETTDALIALGRTAVSGGDWHTVLNAIIRKHERIVSELGLEDPRLDCSLVAFWSEMQQICKGVAMLSELSSSTLDRLQSFGERVSATIFSTLLRFHGANVRMIDAFHLVATDNQFGSANVHFEKTNAQMRDVLSPLLAESVVPVVTGFIGRSESGAYATLGRGGSDYSAAIVAAAMDATELQIWTDVDGMFTADPRLIPKACVLTQLSFAEAGELAYFGAKVLHPKTIQPAIENGIPVRILNTFNPTALGTLITTQERASLKSVTSKKGIVVMNVTSLRMLGAHGFLAKVFEAFGRYRVVVDVLASSEVSISVTVDRDVPVDLLDDLRTFATVDLQTGNAIICLVGEGIRARTDVLRMLFTAIGDVHVRMVSQGASARNITFVVAETDADQAVRNIFHAFFDPSPV